MAGGSGEQHYAVSAYAKPGWSESKSVTKSNAGNKVSVQQHTYRAKNEDKLSGSYERFTVKDKAVSGETFVERGTGRVGYKDELSTSATYKFGDKSGYTKYYREEKVKHVNYDNKNSNHKAVGYYPKYNKY